MKFANYMIFLQLPSSMPGLKAEEKYDPHSSSSSGTPKVPSGEHLFSCSFLSMKVLLFVSCEFKCKEEQIFIIIIIVITNSFKCMLIILPGTCLQILRVLPLCVKNLVSVEEGCYFLYSHQYLLFTLSYLHMLVIHF